jgi:hypothetical protein
VEKSAVSVPGDYRFSWLCKHPGARLRPLGNGEMACDDCMHVAVREDGTPVVWRAPARDPLSSLLADATLGSDPIKALAELITRAGGEVDAASVAEAAAVCDAPIRVVKPENFTAEMDAVILGAPPTKEELP